MFGAILGIIILGETLMFQGWGGVFLLMIGIGFVATDPGTSRECIVYLLYSVLWLLNFYVPHARCRRKGRWTLVRVVVHHESPFLSLGLRICRANRVVVLLLKAFLMCVGII